MRNHYLFQSGGCSPLISLTNLESASGYLESDFQCLGVAGYRQRREFRGSSIWPIRRIAGSFMAKSKAKPSMLSDWQMSLRCDLSNESICGSWTLKAMKCLHCKAQKRCLESIA